MRKLLAIVFVSLFAFQTAGFLIVFELQKYSIRKEIKSMIKQGLPEEDLVVFRIAEEEQNAFLKNFLFFDKNEFRLEGKMYDVLRVEMEANFIYYYCVSDEKESLLFANLDSSVRKSLDDSPSNQNQLRNFNTFISSLYYPQGTNIIFKNFSIGKNMSHYFFSVQSWKNSPSTLPPKS